MITAMITKKMIDFYRGDLHDIEHFLKVNAYAKLIGKLEQVDEDTQRIVDVASIVHDIACPLCREKYGAAYGNRQEEESEALLRPFLAEFDLKESDKERVIYLVTHHHTVDHVNGVDYRILLEADFLVNASEGGMSRESIQNFVERVVRTDAGRQLFGSIYLR